MKKKKLKDLTDKDKRRLRIRQPINDKFCNCKNPKPRHYITHMFEPYTLCETCTKEII